MSGFCFWGENIFDGCYGLRFSGWSGISHCLRRGWPPGIPFLPVDMERTEYQHNYFYHLIHRTRSTFSWKGEYWNGWACDSSPISSALNDKTIARTLHILCRGGVLPPPVMAGGCPHPPLRCGFCTNRMGDDAFIVPFSAVTPQNKKQARQMTCFLFSKMALK